MGLVLVVAAAYGSRVFFMAVIDFSWFKRR